MVDNKHFMDCSENAAIVQKPILSLYVDRTFRLCREKAEKRNLKIRKSE